jgi:cobalt-zinc-cadmium resistance protein CzcA
MRGLPFSISAGVGFIALFGIAVLNGIVLIEHFKELKHQGMKSIDELILKGTTDRLRPVLLTARSCPRIFYPWHYLLLQGGGKTLSDGSYWWTFTATILTMVVLPVLFKVLMEKNLKDLSLE